MHNPNINISPSPANQPFPQAADLSSSARNSASSDPPSSLGLLGVAIISLKICGEYQKQLFCDQGFWRESNVESFWHHSSYFPASVSKLKKKNYSKFTPKMSRIYTREIQHRYPKWWALFQGCTQTKSTRGSKLHPHISKHVKNNKESWLKSPPPRESSSINSRFCCDSLKVILMISNTWI